MTKSSFLSLPSIYQLVVIFATLVAMAVGLDARIGAAVEKNYVGKADYIQKHEELRQELKMLERELKYIRESVDAIRKQVE